MYTSIYIHVHTYMICTYMYYVHKYVRTYVHVCTCMYLRMYMYTCSIWQPCRLVPGLKTHPGHLVAEQMSKTAQKHTQKHTYCNIYTSSHFSIDLHVRTSTCSGHTGTSFFRTDLFRTYKHVHTDTWSLRKAHILYIQ